MAAHRLRRSGARSVLIALTVVFSALALPGGPLPPLGFVSLVPLILALHGAGPVAAAVSAYVAALFGWLLSIGGLATAFSSYVQEPALHGVVAIFAVSALLAAPYGIFGLFYGRFRWPPLLAAACLTLAVSAFPSPLPIDSTHTLYTYPVLIQTLDLGGQPLLLFVFYLFQWNLAEVILCLREGRPRKTALATLLLIVIAVPAYGAFRLRQFRALDSTKAVNVAVMQPDIPLGGDTNPHSADALNPFHTLLEMSAGYLAEHRDVDIVVWPETPLRIPCEGEHGRRREFDDLLTRFRVPLLVNCVEPAHSGDYNTQLLLTPDGRETPYHKLRLFPFGEYLPGESRFPALRRLFPSVSHYVSASDPVVFRVGTHPGMFMAICYEILFPGHVRRFVERGGRIAITASNDAWFGHSRIAEFQVAEAVFQAVQFRVPVVRVSNSGDSLVVRASGEIIPGSRTPRFARAAATYAVQASTARSLYSRAGDVFLYALGLSAVALAAAGRRRGREAEKSSARGGPRSRYVPPWLRPGGYPSPVRKTRP